MTNIVISVSDCIRHFATADPVEWNEHDIELTMLRILRDAFHTTQCHVRRRMFLTWEILVDDKKIGWAYAWQEKDGRVDQSRHVRSEIVRGDVSPV